MTRKKCFYYNEIIRTETILPSDCAICMFTLPLKKACYGGGKAKECPDFKEKEKEEER